MTRAFRFAVLGDPVAHSESPVIHRAMLEISGLEGEYDRIRADEAVLAETVAGLRAGTWDGLNVTMPLKKEAARLADALSPQARRSGSVNTLLINRSGVYGESTDSTVFRRSVARPEFSGCSSVLILGGGGSAAAALVAIESSPVYVSARRTSQAEALTTRLGGEVIVWGAAVANALVINTTPIGMKGESLPEGVLESAGGLIDLPYGAVATPATDQAAAAGIPFVGGHEFLVRQAMESFTMWTGRELRYEQVIAGLRKP